MSGKSFVAPPSVVRPDQILQSANIKVVRVRLRAGERYVYSQMYGQDQKREISSKFVTQGRGTLWRAVDLSYRFADNLLDEADCVEIVVIRNAHIHPIEQVWTTGKERNTIPSYFDSMQWTDDFGTVRIQTGDVIEIRLKPFKDGTPSPDRAGDNGRAARGHQTPPPPNYKVYPPDNPSLINPGPAQARFVAMRACLQRREY
jgi:hypothetical protein